MHKALQYAQGTSLCTQHFTMHKTHYAQDSLSTRHFNMHKALHYAQDSLKIYPKQDYHFANTMASQFTTESNNTVHFDQHTGPQCQHTG